MDLARQMIAEGAFEVQLETDVYALLEEPVDGKLLIWALEIPTYLERPELELRRILDGVEDSAVREAAVAKLDAVDRRREAVAEAAGEPAALERALVELYAAFAELNGPAGFTAWRRDVCGPDSHV